MCILLVLIAYVYHNARFKKREGGKQIGHSNGPLTPYLLTPWCRVLLNPLNTELNPICQ